MKEDKDILKQIGRRDGMTVPDGYFADFSARMAASLEPTPFENSEHKQPDRPRSFWQRVRPYVYMAAMFAGIWCMLKMFTLMTGNSKPSFADSPLMADALGNEVFVNEYIMNDVNQWDLIDEMMDEGFEFDSLYLDEDSTTEEFQ